MIFFLMSVVELRKVTKKSTVPNAVHLFKYLASFSNVEADEENKITIIE